MNCEQVQSLLLSYLDGEITPSERALILAHLSNCTVCQRELNLLYTARDHVRSTLQRRAAQAIPSEKAWSRLEARMAEDAQPSSKFTAWFSRMPRGAGHAFNRSLGDITMRKRYILGSGAAVLALALVAVLTFQRVVPVSAQTILDRATAAQSAQSAAQGIQHTRIEIYENPQAMEGKQAGTTVINESYYDPSTGYYHFLSQDLNGKVLEVGAVDGSYDYTALAEDIHNGSITIHRTPLNQDDVQKKLTGNRETTSSESLFDHFRNNPHVEVAGKESRDGRQVYILVNRNFQTSKLPNGQDQKTFTGTMTMVFDAKTYQLVESETTVYKNGQEIVIEKVRFLVDEILQPGTPLDWSLSDLQNATIVDDQPQESGDVSFETIPAEQLAAQTNLYSQSYVLKNIPEGFTQEIVAMSNQPSDEPYRYEIHYRNASSGAAFNLQAVGVMDEGFIEKSFYDGSYKAVNGLVLNYSSSQPEGSENGTAGMLTVPGGTSFLLDSTLSRAEVEALVDDLVPLK
jgi:hypothetical protein